MQLPAVEQAVSSVLYLSVEHTGQDKQPSAATRYTRDGIRSLLLLMGCKPRYVSKIAAQVFAKVTSSLQDLARPARRRPEHLAGWSLGVHCQQSGTGYVSLPRTAFTNLIQSALAEYKYKSSPGHEELKTACSLREGRRCVIVLLSGTSGSGKSTLASLLATRLGVTTVLSTDSVRHLLRSFYPKDVAPLLWASTYEAGKVVSHATTAPDVTAGQGQAADSAGPQLAQHTASGSCAPGSAAAPPAAARGDESRDAGAGGVGDSAGVQRDQCRGAARSVQGCSEISAGVQRDQCLDGYKAQCQAVYDHLERIIASHEARCESLIIEGVHLSTTHLVALMQRHPCCVPFLLHIKSEAKHVERMAVRAKYMALEPQQNKYVAHMQCIRWIQDYLVTKAEKRGIPRVENSNVDRSVGLIHITLLGVLRRVSRGESVWDPATRTTRVLQGEYSAAVESLMSAAKEIVDQVKGYQQQLVPPPPTAVPAPVAAAGTDSTPSSTLDVLSCTLDGLSHRSSLAAPPGSSHDLISYAAAGQGAQGAGEGQGQSQPDQALVFPAHPAAPLSDHATSWHPRAPPPARPRSCLSLTSQPGQPCLPGGSTPVHPQGQGQCVVMQVPAAGVHQGVHVLTRRCASGLSDHSDSPHAFNTASLPEPASSVCDLDYPVGVHNRPGTTLLREGSGTAGDHMASSEHDHVTHISLLYPLPLLPPSVVMPGAVQEMVVAPEVAAAAASPTDLQCGQMWSGGDLQLRDPPRPSLTSHHSRSLGSSAPNTPHAAPGAAQQQLPGLGMPEAAEHSARHRTDTAFATTAHPLPPGSAFLHPLPLAAAVGSVSSVGSPFAQASLVLDGSSLRTAAVGGAGRSRSVDSSSSSPDKNPRGAAGGGGGGSRVVVFNDADSDSDGESQGEVLGSSPGTGARPGGGQGVTRRGTYPLRGCITLGGAGLPGHSSAAESDLECLNLMDYASVYESTVACDDDVDDDLDSLLSPHQPLAPLPEGATSPPADRQHSCKSPTPAHPAHHHTSGHPRHVRPGTASRRETYSASRPVGHMQQAMLRHLHAAMQRSADMAAAQQRSHGGAPHLRAVSSQPGDAIANTEQVVQEVTSGGSSGAGIAHQGQDNSK